MDERFLVFINDVLARHHPDLLRDEYDAILGLAERGEGEGVADTRTP